MLPRTTRFLLLLTITLAVHSSSAFGVGWGRFTPVPALHESWEQSEYVLFVKSAGGARPANGIATLKVIEALKFPEGERFDEIVVHTGSGSHWPYQFPMDGCAIAFLKFDKAKGTFVGTDVSLAGTTIDPAAYSSYKIAFEKLQQILALEDEAMRNVRILSWYVDCAEDPFTRREAVFGLKKLRQNTGDERETRLSLEQQNRLCEKLVSERPPAEGAYHLANHLHAHKNRELDEYLLESLQRAAEAEWFDFSFDAARLLPLRINLKDEAMKAKIDAYWERKDNLEYDIDDVFAVPADRQKEEMELKTIWLKLAGEIAGECERKMRSGQSE